MQYQQQLLLHTLALACAPYERTLSQVIVVAVNDPVSTRNGGLYGSRRRDSVLAGRT